MILHALAILAVWFLLALIATIALLTAMKRDKTNRRGHRLGKWMAFHQTIK